jgi:hypothetical protein
MIPPEDEYWEVMGHRVVATAFAGQFPVLPWLLEAIKTPGGITHRTKTGLDLPLNGALLVIDERGIGWEVAVDGPDGKDPERFMVTPVFPPHSIGSGRPYANSVMAMGRDAKKAIQVAIRMDIYSGGIIQSFELPEPVTVKSTRPDPANPNVLPVAPDPYGPVVPHPHQPPLEYIPEEYESPNTDPVDNTPIALP